MLINQGFFALFFGILINSRLRKLKIVCKIRDVTFYCGALYSSEVWQLKLSVARPGSFYTGTSCLKLLCPILINSRLRKLKIARVCKIRDVTSQITAELCTLASWMTTEAVSGQARLLLYRNFTLQKVPKMPENFRGRSEDVSIRLNSNTLSSFAV